MGFVVGKIVPRTTNVINCVWKQKPSQQLHTYSSDAWQPGACCNKRNLPVKHFGEKSCITSFVYNIHFNCQINLRFCIEHMTAMFSAELQKIWNRKQLVVDKIHFKKFVSQIKFKCFFSHCPLGAVSIRKTVLPGMAIPMLKIRRPNGRLIFNMEIAIRR